MLDGLLALRSEVYGLVAPAAGRGGKRDEPLRLEPLERGVDGLRGIVPVRADGRLCEVVPAKADYVQEPQRGVRDARVARVGVIELLELLAGAVVGDVNRVALQRPRFSKHRKRPIYL